MFATDVAPRLAAQDMLVVVLMKDIYTSTDTCTDVYADTHTDMHPDEGARLPEVVAAAAGAYTRPLFNST